MGALGRPLEGSLSLPSRWLLTFPKELTISCVFSLVIFFVISVLIIIIRLLLKGGLWLPLLYRVYRARISQISTEINVYQYAVSFNIYLRVSARIHVYPRVSYRNPHVAGALNVQSRRLLLLAILILRDGVRAHDPVSTSIEYISLVSSMYQVGIRASGWVVCMW